MSKGAPVYLLLEEAAKKYGISSHLVMEAAVRGVVRAARVNGHLVVAENDVRRLSEEKDVESLPRYIPLAEALRRYKVSEEVLKEAIVSGKIRVAYIDEEVTVAEQDVRELAKGQEVVVVRREDFEHLRGNKLGIAEAARKYGISQPTLSRWVQKGYVKRVGQSGQKILIDEADVAYATTIYKLKGGRQGMRIFDKEGRPYIPRSRPYRPEKVIVVE